MNEKIVEMDNKKVKLITVAGSLIAEKLEIDYEDENKEIGHVRECDICYQNNTDDIIDLCQVEYDEEEECFRINVYADPTTEDYTHSFLIREKDLQFAEELEDE